MTYNVFGGTLSLTQSINCVSVICALQPYKHWKAVESWNVVKKSKVNR